jgi:putative methyltransferase (TIGR04325 family)
VHLEQIRRTARWVRGLSRIRAGRHLLKTIQTTPLTRSLLEKCLAYHRPFKTLREAEEALSGYSCGGHENSYSIEEHLELSKAARPSDYAALFHLQPILSDIHRVFDLGGNVGNLFYCYSTYLDGFSRVSWQVMDMPANIASGKALAEQRGAHQLSFTTDWMDANGAELLISSGSLHYFEKTLPQMVSELRERPALILINRTPLTEGPPVATVQDNGAHRTACMIYNRRDLVRDFMRLGYVVEDEWSAAELSLEIPGCPEHRISSYSGMFLRHKDYER